MESFKISWRKSTKKDLRRIDPAEVLKITQAVQSLAQNARPQNSIKLKGSDCAYRIRIGDYRVIYEIYDKLIIIEVVRVSHRRDIYRDKE